MNFQSYKWRLLFSIASLMAIGCKSSTNLHPEIIAALQYDINAWGHWVNGQGHSDDVYDVNAVLVNQAGEIYDTKANRQQYHEQIRQNMGSVIATNTIYQVRINDMISYEIGSVTDLQDVSYRQLLILKDQEDHQLRELEVIIPYEEVSLDTIGLTKARSRWIALCNQNNPGELVNRLYEKDAIYYSRGKVIRGTREITKEYDYMANTTYELLLSPLHIESVNENIIFEIGQCSGSYGGKYMLLWRKNSMGNWKIMMDSNF